MTSRFPRNGGAPPSVSDVARAAGVATSTVSRALTMPGRIAEKTRLKVLAAAEELGYKPNLAARNLRVGAAKTIMIVLPGALFLGASQVVSEVLLGIDEALIKEGYSLLIANLDRLASTEEHIMDLAFGGTIAGSIILSSSVPEIGGRSLKDAGLPIVSALFDLSAQGVPSVVSNDRQAMRETTAHLLRLGHRRFFYVSGPDQQYPSDPKQRRPGPEGNYHEVERFAGLKEALLDAGLGEDAVVRWPGNFDFESGVAAAERFLSLGTDRPTGVLCCIDDSAIAFMRTVSKAGLRIPHDVSVIGFDGSQVGAFTNPALASIRQFTDRIGVACAELMLTLIGGSDPADVRQLTVVNCELYERESIGPAP